MSNKTKVALWLVAGALVGFAFGAATQQMGLFICIGVVIGVAMGVASTRAKRN